MDTCWRNFQGGPVHPDGQKYHKDAFTGGPNRANRRAKLVSQPQALGVIPESMSWLWELLQPKKKEVAA